MSLLELLVCLAVMVVMSGLAYAGVSSAIQRSRSAECMAKMKAIGQAIHLYAAENDGKFPRSSHSAGANREPGWAVSISEYLSGTPSSSLAGWKKTFEQFFRCPDDRKNASNNEPESSSVVVIGYTPPKYSYGLNVHFELNPNGDDYVGSPASWRRTMQVPKPSRTILLGEIASGSFSDHFMCHQWSGAGAAKNAVAHDRHLKRSNFLFVDGHVENLPIDETIDYGKGLNLWNPSLAN